MSGITLTLELNPESIRDAELMSETAADLVEEGVIDEASAIEIVAEILLTNAKLIEE